MRAAKDYGQRPTAMILHDPYAMHRKWWDWTWKPTPGIDDAWTDWDFILADVFQVIQDYTDPETGQWMPFDQSGDVYWETDIKYSGSAEALDKARADKEPKPGESYFAYPVFRDPDNKPTLASWAKDIEEGKADRRPPEFRDSRPPTPEERAKMREARGLVE